MYLLQTLRHVYQSHVRTWCLTMGCRLIWAISDFRVFFLNIGFCSVNEECEQFEDQCSHS